MHANSSGVDAHGNSCAGAHVHCGDLHKVVEEVFSGQGWVSRRVFCAREGGRAADLAQYLRRAPKGMQVEAWEGRISTREPKSGTSLSQRAVMLQWPPDLIQERNAGHLGLDSSPGIYWDGHGCVTHHVPEFGFSRVLRGWSRSCLHLYLVWTGLFEALAAQHGR